MNFFMTHISVILCSLVVLMAVRLAWDIKSIPAPKQKLYMVLVGSLVATGGMFFNQVLAMWNFLVVFGLLVACCVVSSPQHLIVKTTLTVVAVVLVSTGVMGFFSPKVPMLSMGPSMWPSSPKEPSFSWLTKNAYNNTNFQYGDNIYFNVENDAKWPKGRYQKRIWGLPGDRLKIRDNKVFVNDTLVADCQDRKEQIDQNIWMCTVTFPNGKTTEITWGLSNLYWIANMDKTLGSNELFVIGDNTVESTDSRELSSIKTTWVKGRFDGEPSARTPWKSWN